MNRTEPPYLPIPWTEAHAGLRVEVGTPTWVKTGVVLAIKDRSIRIRYDGEDRDRVIPDGRGYFVDGRFKDNGQYWLAFLPKDSPERRAYGVRPGARTEPDHDYVSVRDATNLYGVDPKDLRRWLRSGRVKGKQINGTSWQVSCESLGRWLSERR